MMNKQKLKSLIVFMFSFQMILACGKKGDGFQSSAPVEKDPQIKGLNEEAQNITSPYEKSFAIESEVDFKDLDTKIVVKSYAAKLKDKGIIVQWSQYLENGKSVTIKKESFDFGHDPIEYGEDKVPKIERSEISEVEWVDIQRQFRNLGVSIDKSHLFLERSPLIERETLELKARLHRCISSKFSDEILKSYRKEGFRYTLGHINLTAISRISSYLRSWAAFDRKFNLKEESHSDYSFFYSVTQEKTHVDYLENIEIRETTYGPLRELADLNRMSVLFYRNCDALYDREFTIGLYPTPAYFPRYSEKYDGIISEELDRSFSEKILHSERAANFQMSFSSLSKIYQVWGRDFLSIFDNKELSLKIDEYFGR